MRTKAWEGEAMETLLVKYKLLLARCSIVRGVSDEDLYQEKCIILLESIEHYNCFLTD